MPNLVMVAGPNGSGKTTLVRSGVLAHVLDVPDLSINADDYAKELAAGGQPTDEQSLQAAQMSDAHLDAEIAAGRSVLVETVLSSDKFKHRVAAARQAGFRVVLIYVSLKLPELNIGRVANRRRLGGHGVPSDRVLARRSRSHLMFEWFAKEADQVFVFDNSTTSPTTVAFKDLGVWTILDLDLLPGDLADSVRVLTA